MENFITMLNTQMILLIYLLVGVYARKRRIITPQSRQSLVDLIIRIALPCLIFQSFGQDITLQEAKNASQILLLGRYLALHPSRSQNPDQKRGAEPGNYRDCAGGAADDYPVSPAAAL